ncbi:MAG: hypothetical protein NTZ07_00825 [Candidatus Woesebacteria bacterium]|nr:hypothetical protein [Candidatus Woesebacteria bacterium]
MSGPKMGNVYPGALSDYPTWTAHQTPVTAEWENSVGFEFYLVEYELGIAPRGTYKSVKDRLDSFPEYSGFNYFARGYYSAATQATGPAYQNTYFDVAENDIDLVFNLTNRSSITAKVSGWYHIIWNITLEQAAGALPNTVYFEVLRSRNDIDGIVGVDYKNVCVTGIFTMSVNASVYLDAGEYIYGHIYHSSISIVHLRGDRGFNSITFKLIDAIPYTRR